MSLSELWGMALFLIALVPCVLISIEALKFIWIVYSSFVKGLMKLNQEAKAKAAYKDANADWLAGKRKDTDNE